MPMELAEARRTWTERARLKRAIKTRELPPEDALHEPALQSMLTWDFLCCLPSKGHNPAGGKEVSRATELARAIWKTLGVSPLHQVKSLTDRQRAIIVRKYRLECAAKTRC